MRLVLALVSGFVFTFGVFAAGVTMATFYVVGPTQEHAGLDASSATAWSDEPVRVAYAPSPPAPQDARSVGDAMGEERPGIDPVTTSALGGSDDMLPGPAPAPNPDTAQALSAEQEMLVSAHVNWCRDRYRSYRPEDNSYRPYSGGNGFCVSPYLEQLEAATRREDAVVAASLRQDEFGSAPGGIEQDFIQTGEPAAMNGAPTDEHIRNCFDRYRSYQPEDNSYQPYGGGPRRQCF